ncbi:tRNA-dihydrouridine synthase [Candidatus Electronema sp. PJ]|uniref:oxidoreductase n=1 Tax=Candidatus Electronema sp. PJ TaxID=3401572 RepID=UPI003AA96A51
MYAHLFSALKIADITLKNRVIMVPLYLAYGHEDGTVSNLLLEHYRLMAQSGAAMVVVEGATIDYPAGIGAGRMLRVDTDAQLEGLRQLAETIRQEGAIACLQINHAGRFALAQEPVAPSAVAAFGRMPRALSTAEIKTLIRQYAEAALRVKNAGFDMLELHGATGYLLAQFISPRTNQREDEYGGSFETRQRFALEVLAAVKEQVGNFPIGYRFMADELLPDGLQLAEAVQFARSLEAAGIAYLSVTGGTYESFHLPHIVSKAKECGYMADLAAAVKKEVSIPVIAAGRIATGSLAESILAAGKADGIGLARVLWTDPAWLDKVQHGQEDQLILCNPDCGDACVKWIMQNKPAICARWSAEKMKEWKNKIS